MRNLSDYMELRYPIEINSMPDGLFCAEIKAIQGLCAYGSTMVEAIEELNIVKRTAIDLMLSQGKEVPIPTIHLEIPVYDFEKLSNKGQIEKFIVI